MENDMTQHPHQNRITPHRTLYFVWIVALLSTLGSLFFSEVMKLPPCVLCWYQRIAMYPIVILAPIALLTNESTSIMKYLFSLALFGLFIALYHNLLYYGVLSESLTPCKEGISCTSRQIVWLGFVTIPLLSLTGFFAITISVVWKWTRGKKV
jgi:disulfide bond formation protein DsbB